jgi:hypothetical protein
MGRGCHLIACHFARSFCVPRSIVCREQCHLRGRHRPPHGGASRGNLPMCGTHASIRWGDGATASAEWFWPRPRQGRLGASDGRRELAMDQAMGSASRWKDCPDFSMACMMTASLRATAMAARLKPILSRSFTPQVLSALSALVRVSTTVAAS